MTIAAVRAEFGVALATYDEARVYTQPPASPEMPCVIVGFPTSIEFNETLGGQSRYELVLTVLVAAGDIERAEVELDTILTGSLRDELYGHTPASTVWRAFVVESVTNIRAEAVGSAAALAADINITLIA